MSRCLIKYLHARVRTKYRNTECSYPPPSTHLYTHTYANVTPTHCHAPYTTAIKNVGNPFTSIHGILQKFYIREMQGMKYRMKYLYLRIFVYRIKKLYVRQRIKTVVLYTVRFVNKYIKIAFSCAYIYSI